MTSRRCYLQTELGHGTNVAALETTATYIPETREFELHSPTLTSSKWWVGALGKTATHGVVQARLILPSGKDVGPHLFFIQLRSTEDHRLLPGITAGDIGEPQSVRMEVVMVYTHCRAEGVVGLRRGRQRLCALRARTRSTRVYALCVCVRHARRQVRAASACEAELWRGEYSRALWDTDGNPYDIVIDDVHPFEVSRP